MSTRKRMIVVGGGAAGFFGAIRAKMLLPELEVMLLEAAPKPLGKVKISGGGRCNVTTFCFEVSQLVQHYPRGQRELHSVFKRFGPKDTVHWFESHGVPLKIEPDGRIFPVSNDAQTIIDTLLEATRTLDISVHTKTPVRRIQKTTGYFQIETDAGTWEAVAVLLATGSGRQGYAWAESLGHTIIPPVPSLFTFNIQDPLLTDLAGISLQRVRGKLDVPGEKPVLQEGPLLITHWGLSGPVILRLSAWGARALFNSQYQGRLFLDLLPEENQDTVRKRLVSEKERSGKKHVGNACPFDFPKRLWGRLTSINGVPEDSLWCEASHKTLNILAERLKNYPLAIHGKGVFKEEFVTAGGVALKQIDFKTMESRKTPGLYFAGEIIDVDALTGGFNFQNAWSTGWIAGEAISDKLLAAQ